MSGAAQARRVCVVQGASRGIGLELSRQLVARGDAVFATCRDVAAAAALRALQEAHAESMAVVRLDVACPESVAAAAAEVGDHPLSASEQGPVVHMLLNTAGVLQDKSRGIVPENGLSRVEPAAVAASFAVNAIGPLSVMQRFAPLLRRAAAQGAQGLPGTAAAAAVFYSARVGSIGDNRTGGWYAYRGSKAALNQFVRCSAVELRRHGVCVVAMHPGTVDTDLTRAFSRARAKYEVQEVETAARNHLEIVDSLTMQDTGRFLDWRRDEVPW